MTKITITEALSEVNLVKKKIVARTAEISPYVTRYSNITDPFEKSGGSSTKINADMQAIRDLSVRLQKLRHEISQANLTNTMTVEGETKSIHDWLTWKREVYDVQRTLLGNTITQVRQAHAKLSGQSPPAFRDDKTGEPKFASLIVNVDLDALTKELEKVEQLHERLDGQLSLKNATITVEI